jgi:hypothetical protein
MIRTTPGVLAIGGLAAAAALVLLFTLTRTRPSESPPPGLPERASLDGDVATLAASPHLLFRHTGIDAAYNHLAIASIVNPAAPRGTTALQCERVSFAAGRGICLQANRGVFTTFSAVVFDAHFQPVATLKLDGAPSRTRIAAGGRYGAITVFVTGQQHGYASVSFSTKTTLLDMATGTVLGDLEQFATTRDGQPFSAKDFNFWGVTFAAVGDGNTFYGTLMSNRKTYLIRGDVVLRTLTVLHENVECPSLSPDNRLIAFKKRVGGDLAPWRFYLLDLATMSEQPIAGETRSIDDQLEWLDDGHVLYATTRSSQSAISDVWIAAVSGTEPARPFLSQAESPVVVR